MATFLTLPAELRNQIYDLLFVESSPYTPSPKPEPPVLRPFPSLTNFGKPTSLDGTHNNKKPQPLTLTNRQLSRETQLLHLQKTTFSLSGDYADPERFSRLCNASLSPSLVSQLRHITLVGRIPRFRALNELWNGVPFANPHLSLKTLVIVPRRPASYDIHHAEIADQSSAHTLAYILSETLKSLRGVERIIVRNEDGCFNDSMWTLIYTSMINRLLLWAGKLCSCSFRWDHDQGKWFEVLVDGRSADPQVYKDAAHEFQRLMG